MQFMSRSNTVCARYAPMKMRKVVFCPYLLGTGCRANIEADSISRDDMAFYFRVEFSNCCCSWTLLANPTHGVMVISIWHIVQWCIVLDTLSKH